MEATSGTTSNILEKLELITLHAVEHLILGEKCNQEDKHFALPLLSHDRKIVLRISYIAFLAHCNISSGKLLTKRDVFYLCRPLFPTPASVDRALHFLSSSLNVGRNELNIVAVPKGLVVGQVSYNDEFGNSIDVGMFGDTGCLIPARPERLTHVVADNRGVIVVEKEAAFHSLIDESRAHGALSSFVIVTGKGYPDFGTRLFIRTMCDAQEGAEGRFPIYLLTDADPHGLSIANCYLESLRGRKVHWLGVRHSDFGKMFGLRDSQILRLNDAENILLDGMLKRWGQNGDRGLSAREALMLEAKVMKVHQTKFEMEALACNSAARLERCGLVDYVLCRIRCEELSSTHGTFTGLDPKEREEKCGL